MTKRRSLQMFCLLMTVMMYMIVYRFSIHQHPPEETPSYCVLTSPLSHHFIVHHFMTSSYGNGTCPVCHSKSRLRELLVRWDEMCRKHNITYMLTYGSLLGSLRNSDVIPWDTDLDVYIESRDNIKLSKLQDSRSFNTRSESFHLVLDVDWDVLPVAKRRSFTCDGRLGTTGTWNSCSFQGPLGRLIKGYEQYLDIWDLDVLSNGSLFDRYPPGHHYQRSDIYPLQKCSFMGVETWCPSNPEVIFDVYYGYKEDRRSMWICKDGEWIRRTSLNTTTK